MKVIVCKDYDDMSKKAADLVISNIKEKPQIKLGLATGSTPVGLYKNLINASEDGEISFRYAKSVNLDEYVGIDKENEQSYNYFMKDKFFNHVSFEKGANILPEAPENDEKYAKAYDKILDDFGQRDIQILGVGENGHIAFMEPNDKLNKRTSIVKLTDDTIEVNSRFFDSVEDVPNYAISMGMADIFNAKTIILLANGKKKHEVVKKLIESDKVDPQFPVSFLNLHPNAYVYVDEEAYRG